MCRRKLCNNMVKHDSFCKDVCIVFHFKNSFKKNKKKIDMKLCDLHRCFWCFLNGEMWRPLRPLSVQRWNAVLTSVAAEEVIGEVTEGDIVGRWEEKRLPPRDVVGAGGGRDVGLSSWYGGWWVVWIVWKDTALSSRMVVFYIPCRVVAVRGL